MANNKKVCLPLVISTYLNFANQVWKLPHISSNFYYFQIVYRFAGGKEEYNVDKEKRTSPKKNDTTWTQSSEEIKPFEESNQQRHRTATAAILQMPPDE